MKKLLEKRYDVHDDGQILDKKNSRFVSQIINSRGYVNVNLKINNKWKVCALHRIVWSWFYGDIPKGYEINHLDENKQNNEISNLLLVTHKQNCNWASRNERIAIKHIGIKRPYIGKILAVKLSKAVVAVDNDGNVVMEFTSTVEASKNGFSRSAVGSCCRGERKTHKGYRWFWKDEWEKIKNGSPN